MMTMRRVVCAGMVLMLGAIVCAESTTGPAPEVKVAALSGKLGEPVELFDGKSLGGWVWVPKAPKSGEANQLKLSTINEIWHVKDGLLSTAGKPTGYIRTTTEYDNYVLTVEQRHPVKGNGGVLFAITGPDKVWPHCLEAQGQNGEEGDIRNVANFPDMEVDKARLDPPDAPKRLKRLGDSEKAVGEWETIEVTVDHGNLTLRVMASCRTSQRKRGV